MMKIGFYGISGLYNYGCEAIIRGSVSFLKTIFGNNIEIIYFSYCYDYDISVIGDLNIKVINLNRKNSIIKKIVSKLFDLTRIPYIPFYRKDFKKIREMTDIVFSIGGDIYTIPAYFLKRDKYAYANRIVSCGNYIMKNKEKYFIWGASIGPFGEYKKAKNYYFNHLKKVNLIVARENNCVKYLKDNGLDNVYFLPDPAFWVKPLPYVTMEQKYIGFNFSPLSLNEVKGNVSKTDLEIIAKEITTIIDKTGYDCLLIPHVINPYNENDNDLSMLNAIFNILPPKIKNKTIWVGNSSFVEIKKELKKCHVLIAARMHCAINGVSEYVPTLFLSYSEKAKGMSNFIYGTDEWCLPINQIENNLARKTMEMLSKKDKIKKYLESRIKDIRDFNNYSNIISEIKRHIKE